MLIEGAVLLAPCLAKSRPWAALSGDEVMLSEFSDATMLAGLLLHALMVAGSLLGAVMLTGKLLNVLMLAVLPALLV